MRMSRPGRCFVRFGIFIFILVVFFEACFSWYCKRPKGHNTTGVVIIIIFRAPHSVAFLYLVPGTCFRFCSF